MQAQALTLHTCINHQTRSTPAQPHTLLTSSPCGLVKRQFAACSKAGLRVAVASQVTNWQDCFSFDTDCGRGCFRRRRRVTLSEARVCAGAWRKEKWLRRYSCLLFLYFFFLSLCQCLSLSSLSLCLRATNHIIYLLHPPSPSLLICAVIMLPPLCFFLSFCFSLTLRLSPYSISKFQESFNSVFKRVAEEAVKERESHDTSDAGCDLMNQYKQVSDWRSCHCEMSHS